MPIDNLKWRYLRGASAFDQSDCELLTIYVGSAILEKQAHFVCQKIAFFIFSVFSSISFLFLDVWVNVWNTKHFLFFFYCKSDQPSMWVSFDFELDAMLICCVLTSAVVLVMQHHSVFFGGFFFAAVSAGNQHVGLTSRGQRFQTQHQHLLSAAASPPLAALLLSRFTFTTLWGLLISLFVGISFSSFSFWWGEQVWKTYCFYCYLCAFWDVYFS